MSLIHYQFCPVCNSNKIKYSLEAKDNTVSEDVFPIWECGECTLRFTQDVPDSESISPYYQAESYISHTDTRKGLINNVYHRVRSHTLREKRKLLQRICGTSHGKVLDIGAGTGAFLNEMVQSGWEARGLEPDPGARRLALENYGLQLDESELLFSMQPLSFDVITLWHVLEHVHQLHEYLHRIHELLRPGGNLIIAVPNYQSEDARQYGGFWAAYDVPRHLYHFSPASIKKLLSIHGFAEPLMKPMWFDAFYISMLSEKYKKGKPDNVAAFFNGIRSNSKAFSSVEKTSSVIYISKK